MRAGFSPLQVALSLTLLEAILPPPLSLSLFLRSLSVCVCVDQKVKTLLFLAISNRNSFGPLIQMLTNLEKEKAAYETPAPRFRSYLANDRGI